MLDNLKRVAGVRGKEPCHVLGTIERCRIRQDAAEEFDKAICLSSELPARLTGRSCYLKRMAGNSRTRNFLRQLIAGRRCWRRMVFRKAMLSVC